MGKLKETNEKKNNRIKNELKRKEQRNKKRKDLKMLILQSIISGTGSAKGKRYYNTIFEEGEREYKGDYDIQNTKKYTRNFFSIRNFFFNFFPIYTPV